jgi:hypothetical protein
MHQSRGESRKLREVKGLLHRLQELPAEVPSADLRPAERGFRRGYLVGIASTTTVMVTAAVVLVFGFGYVFPGFGPQATSTPKDGPNRQPVSAPSSLPVAMPASAPPPTDSKGSNASGLLTGSAVSPKDRPITSATVSSAVEAAQALLSTGRVQAARQRLLATASEGSADVAWALARSYDPNHLKGIEGADAGPDVAEATRWYRTWHGAAVKQGMIADGVSLEKIIGSMLP